MYSDFSNYISQYSFALLLRALINNPIVKRQNNSSHPFHHWWLHSSNSLNCLKKFEFSVEVTMTIWYYSSYMMDVLLFIEYERERKTEREREMKKTTLNDRSRHDGTNDDEIRLEFLRHIVLYKSSNPTSDWFGFFLQSLGTGGRRRWQKKKTKTRKKAKREKEILELQGTRRSSQESESIR